MSGDAQQALQKALFQALSGDGVLTGLIGAGRIFDRQVTRAPLPYIVFGEIVSQDWSTASETGSEHRVTIDVWSGAEGRAQAQAIAAAIHDILHDADLTLATHLFWSTCVTSKRAAAARNRTAASPGAAGLRAVIDAAPA